MHKCYGCGVEKDMEKLEVFPYPELEMLCEGPIEPLFVLECQDNEEGGNRSDFRIVVVCHECFRKLEPDMWIGKRCWKGINAIVKFENLPKMLDQPGYPQRDDAYWNPASYPVL